MLDTILFDLDGTLLPMEQDAFIHAYVKQLCARYVPCGFEKDDIVRALWAGTAAMVRNDGTCTNEERFWIVFDQLPGGSGVIRDSVEEFYTGPFDTVREIVSPTPLSRQIVDTLRLTRPMFRQTAAFGHFGRKEFPWERTDKVEALRNAVI